MNEIDTVSNFKSTLQDSSSDPSLNPDLDPQKEYGTIENTDHFKLEHETASEMMTEIDTVSNFKSTLQDSSSDPSLNPDPDPQKEYGTMENTDHFQLEHDTASGMMTEIDTVSNFKSTLQEMNTDTGDPMTLEQDENLYNGKIHQGKIKSIRYTETNERTLHLHRPERENTPC